eukprot:1321681-Amorphochlora_amoeboformis.AAC.1
MEAGIRPVAAISDVKGLQARRSQRQTYGSFHSDDAMSPRAVEYASLVDQMYLDDQARNVCVANTRFFCSFETNSNKLRHKIMCVAIHHANFVRESGHNSPRS